MTYSHTILLILKQFPSNIGNFLVKRPCIAIVVFTFSFYFLITPFTSHGTFKMYMISPVPICITLAMISMPVYVRSWTWLLFFPNSGLWSCGWFRSCLPTPYGRINFLNSDASIHISHVSSSWLFLIHSHRVIIWNCHLRWVLLRKTLIWLTKSQLLITEFRKSRLNTETFIKGLRY